jgi:hypothetical protein
MKKTLLLTLVLIACEKEGVFSWYDASSARRGPSLELDAGTPVIDALPAKDLPFAKEASVPPDTVADLLRDITPDLNRLDLQPDVTPLSTGTKCSKSSDCQSGFCTDGVCCVVEKCVDTCIPSATYACAPYMGFTCSPLGTCRGF